MSMPASVLVLAFREQVDLTTLDERETPMVGKCPQAPCTPNDRCPRITVRAGVRYDP